MSRYFFSFLFFVAYNLIAYSQVVNIERKRLDADSTGVYGNIKASLSLIQNTKRIWNSAFNFNVLRIKDKHQWYFIGNIKFQKAEETDLVNKGYEHIRYNYKLVKNGRAYLEMFEQLQFDAVRKIDKRFLTGGGVRFSPLMKQKARINIGAGAMYEYEIFKDASVPYNWLRINSYVSFQSKIFKNLFFYTTTYYQPLPTDFSSNYRIFNNTGVSVAISSKFSFFSDFEIIYDTFLPLDIPETVYYLKNGLSYKF